MNRKPVFLNSIRVEYTKLKEDFANKKTTKEYLSFEEAQKNPAKIDWTGLHSAGSHLLPALKYLTVMILLK